ncbi:hypothetical protein FBUS_09460 [Fasciolopsis buskii]|uniref:Uncharacterized protein n=1 Tax=Fasciolopsis buskii TaxID=27845 RepID=A0A8E0RQH7_9TREM|nr:hypothetical protein FBUS_09460 [Fasciolopsis buski]
MSDTNGFPIKRCTNIKRLDGKTAVVTGANAEIGFHKAGELARREALVIMACRNKNRTEAAKTKLLSLFGKDKVDWMKTGMADPCVVESVTPIKADQVMDIDFLK